MRKVLLFLLLSPIMLIAQEPGVAINTDGSAADAKAMLDIKSINKGILIPRMLSSERTAITPVPKGLLVFDNTTNSFWFYSGTAWEELKGGGNAGWQLLGNTGTDPATNFIGTTDNKPLHFKVSNDNAGTISVGIRILALEGMHFLLIRQGLLIRLSALKRWLLILSGTGTPAWEIGH